MFRNVWVITHFITNQKGWKIQDTKEGPSSSRMAKACQVGVFQSIATAQHVSFKGGTLNICSVLINVKSDVQPIFMLQTSMAITWLFLVSMFSFWSKNPKASLQRAERLQASIVEAKT